jgi:hypothetical protein
VESPGEHFLAISRQVKQIFLGLAASLSMMLIFPQKMQGRQARVKFDSDASPL